MAQWVGLHPANQKVTGTIPGQGTCQSCGPGPWLGCARGSGSMCFSHTLMFLSLHSLLSKNKFKKNFFKEYKVIWLKILIDNKLLCNNLTWKSDPHTGFYLVPVIHRYSILPHTRSYVLSLRKNSLFNWFYLLHLSCPLTLLETTHLTGWKLGKYSFTDGII